MASSMYQRGPVKVQANLTPLIDVVFLLITFFLLVAQIQRTRLERMELPRLPTAETSATAPDDAIVVNIRPLGPDGEARGYRFGSQAFEESPAGLRELVDALKSDASVRGEPRVLVRASRTEAYERVHPVLSTIAQAGLTSVHLVTIDEAAP